MKYYIKCDSCGRFVSFKELQKSGGASWVFVPYTDISMEENIIRCKVCTELYGKPFSRQSVVHELTSGVF